MMGIKTALQNMAGAIKRVLRNWKNTSFWRYGLIVRLSKLLYNNKDGFDVNSEDWDYLIILDACRYDIFAEEAGRRNLQGNLEHRISKGSMTSEFLTENFGNRNFDNIVYITSNPFINILLKNRFYKIVPVWEFGWDSELNTVRPEQVYNCALDEIPKHAGKKFIIHFMQPHHPFLTLKIPKTTGIKLFRESVVNNAELQPDIGPWGSVLRHDISAEQVIEAYKENLRIAMDYVEKLIPNLHGKIVITSDHGEGFGEPLHRFFPIKVYGHPQKVRIEPLIKVPWFVIDKQ